MTPILSPLLRQVAAATLFVLGLSVDAWSQVQSPAFSKEGGFAAVTFMPGFTFDGVTFDGETLYKEIGGEEFLFLPRIDKQPLIRGILGYRGRTASLEVSYERTQHDGSFVDVPFDSVFQAVNVDGRYFFLPTGPVQPHVLVGGSFPWFRVKEGSLLDPESAMRASAATASTPKRV